MLKYFYKIKNIEGFLGGMGLVFILILLVLTVFLIKMLISFLFSSMTPGEMIKELPPVYNFESSIVIR